MEVYRQTVSNKIKYSLGCICIDRNDGESYKKQGKVIIT